jgi:hypothetical protein
MADINLFELLGIKDVPSLLIKKGDEWLWGTTLLASAGTLSNSANATDRKFDGTVATWRPANQSGAQYLTHTVIDDSGEADLTRVSKIEAVIRFNTDTVLYNDTFTLQIYDGSTWQTLATFNTSNQPPQVLTEFRYDVTSFLNTLTKVQACQFRFNYTRVGGAVDVYIYLDEVQIILHRLWVEVKDDIAINDDTGTSVKVGHAVTVNDSVGIAETISAYPTDLYLYVLDPFYCTVTEHIDVLDLMVEVGIVMSPVVVEEYAEMFIPSLFDFIYEDIGVVQNVELSLSEVYAENLYDDIIVQEQLDIVIDVLFAYGEADSLSLNEYCEIYFCEWQYSVDDNILISDSAEAQPDLLNIEVYDSLSSFDLGYIENFILFVGVICDLISITEYATTFIAELYPELCKEDIVVNEWNDNATSGKQMPFNVQVSGWYDGTRFWRIRFDIMGQYIAFEYTINPQDRDTWVENENARITVSGVTNDFSVCADNTHAHFVCKEGDKVKYRVVTLDYETPNWVWETEIIVFEDTGKSYMCGNIFNGIISGDVYFTATKIDGANRYIVGKELKSGSFSDEYTIGDTENTKASLSTVRPFGDADDKIIVIYNEGTSIYYRPIIEDVLQDRVYVCEMMIPTYAPTPHHYACFYEGAHSQYNFLLYVNPDGNLCMRIITPSYLSPEYKVDEGTNNIHPTIGYNQSDNYIVAIWAKSISSSLSEIYYQLRNSSGVQVQSTMLLQDTSFGRIKRVSLAFTVGYYISAFLWEEGEELFSTLISLGLLITDDVVLVEDREISLDILYVECADNVIVTEDVNIYPDELFTGVGDEVFVNEWLLEDSGILNASISDDIVAEENLAYEVDVYFIDVLDDVLISEDVAIGEGIIFIDCYDSVVINENAHGLLNILFLFVYEPFGILITEHADVIDGWYEVGVVDSRSEVSEWVNLYLDILVPFAPDMPYTMPQHKVDEYVDLYIPVAFSVVDSTNVDEQASAGIPIIDISKYEQITVTEAGALSRDPEVPIYIISVVDIISMSEDFVNEYDVLGVFVSYEIICADELGETDIYIDELFLEVTDSIAITDFNSVITPLYCVDVFEVITQNELIRIEPEIKPTLYINVHEVISWIGDFVTFGIDRMVAVNDGISVIENIDLTDLEIDVPEVSDDIIIAEFAETAYSEFDVPELSDDIIVSEDGEIAYAEYAIEVYEDIGIIEAIHIPEPSEEGAVDVAEDILVEEAVEIYSDLWFINVYDTVATTEDITLAIRDLLVSVYDSIISIDVFVTVTLWSLTVYESVIISEMAYLTREGFIPRPPQIFDFHRYPANSVTFEYESRTITLPY